MDLVKSYDSRNDSIFCKDKKDDYSEDESVIEKFTKFGRGYTIATIDEIRISKDCEK